MDHLDDVVASYRILAEYGVIDAYGHVSLRSPTNPQRYYLARSLAPERVQAEDILEYDLDSNPLDARGRESVTERFIHGEILKARPDIMAVVHNHSPSVVPFSVTGVPMRALWHMAAFIGDGLPNWEIRDVCKGTDLLGRDAQLGNSVAKALGAKPAALMRGHGPVTVGQSVPRDGARSIYLELSARIEKLNPVLNAFNLVSDRALDDAKASEAGWRAGQPKGLLDGVPVSIKDIILTKGWPTLRGSKTVDAKGPWNDDAPATARLREHGAVLIGKTTTPEFGWKGVTDSALTGITRNPWNPKKTPGGSSGGAAAALASGMGALAVGTDGGGSIRIPCSFTGLFGLKASFGRVPAWPLSPFGTVAHVGPMTRSVADAALMLNVLALPDARDWHALPYDARDYRTGLDGGVADLRIAFSPDLGYAKVDPEIAALLKKAASVFADLGARVEEKSPGFANPDAIFRTHWFSGAAMLVNAIAPEKRKLIDPGLREVAEEGAKISAAEL